MVWYDIQFSNNDAVKNWSGVFTHVSPGEEEIPYKSDGKAHRKIKIKLLRDTNVGVDQALTDPNKGGRLF